MLDDVPRIEVLERLATLLIDAETKVADGFLRAGRRLGFGLEDLELPLSSRIAFSNGSSEIIDGDAGLLSMDNYRRHLTGGN